MLLLLLHQHSTALSEQGVFAGGVESASELVRRGEASPKDFMLLAGYSGWGPWQLQQELAAGTWLPVAASQAVIMDVLKGACCVCPVFVGLGSLEGRSDQ